MKSPNDVQRTLRRQWQSADTRVHRLLGGSDAWPIDISIGPPSADRLRLELGEVKRHIDQWRAVSIGEVVWSERTYRSTNGAILLPKHWRLRRPTDWVAACNDRQISTEFETLSKLIAGTDPIFHEILIRRRSMWREKSAEEVVLAATVAMQLYPGAAGSRPLRMLSLAGSELAAGTDTKFFERHERLVTMLLDQRFDGEPSRMGLSTFLEALSETDHWVLVVDLDGDLLPFEKQRVRCTELRSTPLPSGVVLIVENETCAHLLPRLTDTIAVLGSGFDLGWTTADWLSEKRVGYWGDIDTWGLTFLAQARNNLPHLKALMMDSQIFAGHRDAAVVEPVPAPATPPAELTESERDLYRQLLALPQGRLEQEFIDSETVRNAIVRFRR